MSAYYATRRMAGAGASSATWARNRNAVRHNPKLILGPFHHTLVVALVVLFIGLLFLTQSAKVTNYDVDIARVDTEITNLEAQRDALAVENAKITAAAADIGRNEVAAAMVDAENAAFVKE